MDPEAAAKALEAWYATRARVLPWRRGDPDPYHVLVAEFILQQTRIETGLRYFERFVARYPTIQDLAAADESDVLALWSGLGYYRRARNLHRTARRIVADHAGRVPADVTALEALPGIGPYTAGAIASIAYDRPEPSIDGNQARVLARLLDERDPDAPTVRRRLAAWARDVLTHGSPRRLNQALMDLGSAVCTPRSPRCPECPLSAACPSRGRGDRRPRQRATAAPVDDRELLLHVRGGALWLRRPTGRGVLGDLWMPPARPARGPVRRPDATHAFSHLTWRIRWVRTKAAPRGDGRWVRRAELAGLPHGPLVLRAFDAAGLP